MVPLTPKQQLAHEERGLRDAIRRHDEAVRELASYERVRRLKNGAPACGNILSKEPAGTKCTRTLAAQAYANYRMSVIDWAAGVERSRARVEDAKRNVAKASDVAVR